MAKDTSKRFVVTFPLVTEKWQADILEKRFRKGELLTNQLHRRMDAKYREMIKTKEFRGVRQRYIDLNKELKAEEASKDKNKAKIKELKADIKETGKMMSEIYKNNHFTEFGFYSEMTQIYKPYNKWLDSTVSASLAQTLWSAYERFLYKDARKINWKQYGSLNTLRARSNNCSIRYVDGYITWKKLKMKVVVDPNNPYEVECFQNEIAYSAIKRRTYKGRTRYYAQITFKGEPPAKYNKTTGEFTRVLGKGECVIKLLPNSVIVIKDGNTEEFPLTVTSSDAEQRLNTVEFLMERSRRANNPDNYNEDGTAKSLKKDGRLRWHNSKRYNQLKAQKRDINEKLKNARKNHHQILSNQLLRYGDSFTIITTEMKKEQSRDKGKKGKTIANAAPAMFKTMFVQKVNQLGGVVVIQNTAVED